MSAKRTFVDSAFFVALTVQTDQWHAAAAAWFKRAERESLQLATTWPVLLEVGNSLSKRQFRSAGARLIAAIVEDPGFTILPTDEDFMESGLELFSSRRDKEWSLTDCLSFLVMTDHGMTDALTSDIHFEQAGSRRCCAKISEPDF